MDYFLGAAIAIAVIFISRYFYEVEKSKNSLLRIKFRQSHVFEMTRFSNIYVSIKDDINTQASRYFDQNRIRMVFAKDKAYWIKDSSVYEANLIDGLVEENSAKIVDMMALSDVELKDMMFIVDKLTEGINNDSSDSRDS